MECNKTQELKRITMALRNVIICGILSSSLIFISKYSILFSFFSNFYVVRCLRESYTLYRNSNIILTTRKKSPARLRDEFIFCATLILAHVFYFVYLLFDQAKNVMVTTNLLFSLIMFCISMSVLWLKKLTPMEKSYLNTINNLTYGYGAAISYYKNYLSIIMPTQFLAAATKYENKESVKIPHKLYILFPKSCKVKKNIDHIDNIENIEGAKDLPSIKKDHGGIKDREYRVSAYRIRNNGEYFRCALEYAQPLKRLWVLKEKGDISLEEMYTERETFIKHLSQMLKDRESLIDFCELVEYDDEVQELHVVLASLASIQKYKKNTVE